MSLAITRAARKRQRSECPRGNGRFHRPNVRGRETRSGVARAVRSIWWTKAAVYNGL